MRWPAGLDERGFLEQYWQKRPLQLPAALPGYGDALEGDDLAALACDPEIESRLVLRHAGDRWELRHGPFDEAEFAGLPARDWTLLVQDVDKHLDPVAAVLGHFAFLPAWRLDDVMISYAAPGGSVGPHVDAYDVFLLQATGSRTWALDPAPAAQDLRADAPLRVLERFTPREQVVLGPGDVLYLPPGVAHHGVGEAPCLTWSVGFRAPSAGDLLRELAATMDAREPVLRYGDRDLAPGECAGGRISAAAVARAGALLEAAAARSKADAAVACLGRAVTRPKPWLAPDAPEAPPDAAALAGRLRDGARLYRPPASRVAWHEDDRGVWLFADGESWRLPAGLAPLAARCAGAGAFGEAELPGLAAEPAAMAVLAGLAAQGSLAEWSETDGAPAGDGSS